MPQQNDNKLSLRDYLQLYSAFSPEQTTQTALGLEKLQQLPEEAQDREQQRQVVNQLREEQGVDRRAHSLLEGANAAGLDPKMAPYASSALQQYFKLLGITAPQQQQPVDQITDRIKQRKH